MVVVGSVALYRGAFAAATGSADRAKAVLAELDAEPSGQELTAPAVERARQSIARADAATVPAHAAILGDSALEWAEVARDLKRASLAEQASDHLEQEASVLETELARLHAAVEQALARVGQARHALAKADGGEPRPAPPAKPAPAKAAPAPSQEHP